METAEVDTGPYPAIIDWLQQHRVEYELHEHPRAFTAAETANAEGVEPASFAKVVGVRASDGRTALAVLDATDQVELGELAKELGVRGLRCSARWTSAPWRHSARSGRRRRFPRW